MGRAVLICIYCSCIAWAEFNPFSDDDLYTINWAGPTELDKLQVKARSDVRGRGSPFQDVALYATSTSSFAKTHSTSRAEPVPKSYGTCILIKSSEFCGKKLNVHVLSYYSQML